MHTERVRHIDGIPDGVDYHQFFLVADEDWNAFPESTYTNDISPHTLAVPGHASV